MGVSWPGRSVLSLNVLPGYRSRRQSITHSGQGDVCAIYITRGAPTGTLRTKRTLQLLWMPCHITRVVSYLPQWSPYPYLPARFILFFDNPLVASHIPPLPE